MKVGDKLYCKKIYSNRQKYFNKNVAYEILRIFNISPNPNKDDFFYVITSEIYFDPFGNKQISITFDINDVNEFFYSNQELRKIKLDKIDNDIIQ